MVRIAWSKIVLWKCRARLSHIEDTLASIEGKSSFPVGMVSAMVAVEHPGDVHEQRELLEAERDYYARRVEVMEARR
ncbi:hypothetical protein GJ632_07680 [Halogeometricum sp. CBA1124]|nr:hypothetical protein [Halogeometricum sp. CBA1124]